jgi:thioester reductase-like protein
VNASESKLWLKLTFLKGASEGAVLTERAIDAKVAAGSGYTESKWVAEQILAKAEESTPLKPVAVRVGQLCGDANGAWNTTEWFPALVQASSIIRHVPDSSKVGSCRSAPRNRLTRDRTSHGFRSTLLLQQL